MAMSFLRGETRWGLPGLHSQSDLRWQEGSGPFEGGKVAVLGTNRQTGAFAGFIKMPAKSLMDSHNGRLHSHTSTSHTFIIEGEVRAIIGGKEITGKAGDYFRLPAGVPHQGSIVPVDDVTMFMLTDGEFGLEFRDEKDDRSMDALMSIIDWSMPSFHQRIDRLAWQEGSGTFAGGKVSIVGDSSKSGATVSFLRMPRKALMDSHDGRLHCHTSTSHTFIVEGEVGAVINGQEITGKTGDYFRMPAGFLHQGSIVPQADTTMFIMTESEFDTVMID
jgi:quercetin dioxygenase-like cupin family protein